MDRNLKRNYINKINRSKGLYHLLGIMAFGAAPTIQEIKPASVLTLHSKDLSKSHLEDLKWVCNYFQIDYLILRQVRNSNTVLFYKETILREHLKLEKNRYYLMNCGYVDSFDQQLYQLQCKYNEEFPHEIGVFLGIPPIDVEGFIENNGKNYLLNGYWKVYYNLEEAKNTFLKFDAARIEILTKLEEAKILH